jgi:hypothetical protein
VDPWSVHIHLVAAVTTAAAKRVARTMSASGRTDGHSHRSVVNAGAGDIAADALVAAV